MKTSALLQHVESIEEQGLNQENIKSLRAYLLDLKNNSNYTQNRAISVLIKIIDDILSPLSKPGKKISQNEFKTLLHTLNQLQEVLTSNVIDLPSETIVPANYTIMIALKDKALLEELSQQIHYFSYEVQILPNVAAILKCAEQRETRWGAIILDLDLCQNSDIEDLKTLGGRIPILYIATQGDIATRLFAVKAGGQAFFQKPLEFASLIEKIDAIVNPESESPPYRILIIEDSRTQANIIRKHLDQAGMITEILMDPLRVNEVLIEFQPELILLDFYMPQCTGLELAKVIRQQDLFVSIPIVFLSAEDNTDKQLLAMSGGGDDFLTKPISPNHLIAAVSARAMRSRTLRAEMIQDSLTGLLNHTRILEQLDLEIARAKRHNVPLAFAMLDIDHFKSINDNHGHPVGDRVIKGLARLLKQRLRKEDSIGRYGGEEFAIVFPQTSNAHIINRLEELRHSFSKLLHRSENPLIEFTATFSVGLAELSNNVDTVDKLVQEADRALYAAKEKGRNCLVLAPIFKL